MNKTDVRRKQVELFSAALAVFILWVFGWRAGEYGIAYLTGAVLCIAALWIIIGSHLAEALGKLLRSRNARGQFRNASGGRRNIMVFQTVFGLIGSLLLLFLADRIAEGLIGIKESTLIIRILAPYLFLHSIASVLKGYLQGIRNEKAICVVLMIRQALILGLGLFFENRCHAYGDKVGALLGQEKYAYMHGAAGIAVGVVLAELIVAVLLFFIYQKFGKKAYRQENEGKKTAESPGTHLRIIFSYRGAMILTRIMEILPFFLGIILFMRRQEDKNAAVVNLGGFVGGYLAQCIFAVLLIAVFLIPVCTRITGLVRKDEQRYAKACFLGGLHITIVHALFWSVMFTVLSQQVEMLLPLGNQMTGKLLNQGAVLILPAVLCYFFLRLLSGFGGQYLVTGIKGIGDIVFVFLFLILLNKGNGIQAFVPALLISAAAECLLSGMLIFRQLRIGAGSLLFAVVPLCAVCASGLLCLLFRNVLMPHLGAMVTMIICVLGSGMVYWVLLILLRNFKEEELQVLYGGKMIRALGEMLQVYKKR